jgi:preprotein translocase subunit SecG
MGILIFILTTIHVLVALSIIVLVLMQKSSDQGIGAAFGGGFTDSMFGGGTATALVRMTTYCACVMLATTLLLAMIYSHHRGGRGSVIDRALDRPAATSTLPFEPAAVEPPAPSAPAQPDSPAAP